MRNVEDPVIQVFSESYYEKTRVFLLSNVNCDAGPCKTYIHKWRFEVTTQECLTFIWGGCHGNGQNRFDSEAECLAHCVGGNREFINHSKRINLLKKIIKYITRHDAALSRFNSFTE